MKCLLLILVGIFCSATSVSSFTNNYLLKRTSSEVDDAVLAAVEGMRLYGPRLTDAVPGAARSLDVVRLENKLHEKIGDLIGKYIVTYVDTVKHLVALVEQTCNEVMRSLHDQMLHLTPDGSNIQQLALDFIATLQEQYESLGEHLAHALGISDSNDMEWLTTSLLSIGGTVLQNMIADIDLTSIFATIGNEIRSVLGGVGRSGGGGGEEVVPRVISSIWNIITDTLGSILLSLGDKYQAFKDWIQQTLQAGLDFAQPHVDNITELAQQVINNIASMPQQAIIQALDFFRPWQDTLGPIWDQLMEIGGNLLPRS